MFNQWRARKLHLEGMARSDAGDEEGALARYARALTLDPNRATTHYNVGLIHKYRRRWRESFASNQRAVELAPEDSSSKWNLAIAATALREWRVARTVWQSLGIPVPPGEDSIESNFGSTPVRLNPEGHAEVVWARRLCPVRARILNIPLPESGFRHGDVVLHDGAPVGYRRDDDGSEKSVFNVLELFERSPFVTLVVRLLAPTEADVAALIARCEEAQLECEDWSASLHYLCKACSEGRPHDQHDHASPPEAWNPQRRLAIATKDTARVRSILDQWTTGSRRAEHIV